MNDFQRLQALCDDLERARLEIVKALEEIEAVRADAPTQPNENLVRLLEESIALAQAARAPQSIEAAVRESCEGGPCAACHCLGEK